MIEYRKGNLLDVKNGIIAHGCNCHGVMGSGVALAVKNKYPAAFETYVNFCKAKKNSIDLLGLTQVERVSSSLLIANMFTQHNFGSDRLTRYVSYDAIDKCFSYINNFTEAYNLGTVHIPKIGSGLGNGHWGVISEIINHRCSVDVICWEL